MNTYQQIAVDEIRNLINSQNININSINNCFFWKGSAGSGKTFAYHALYNLLIGSNVKVCSMAYTGIAATLLPRGKTVHKTFGLPVPLYSDSSSYIKAQSKEAEYLRNTDVFFWDEATMSPRYALEIADRTLRDITGNNTLFGEKIMILAGDFRQILPIQLRSTRTENIDLSIKRSLLWRHFKVLNFPINMRALPSETEFCSFLLQIGDGTLNENGNNVKLSHFPPQCIASNESDIVQDTYGEVLRNKKYTDAVNYAILSPRNDDVYNLNEKVVDLLDETTEKIYTSLDSTENCDNGALSDSLSPEYLNSLNPSSLPPYELRLRLNAVVILIRNLDIEEGLCNGTRLLISKMANNVLYCTILTGDQAGQVVFLSRISLYSENDYSFKFKRRQFPIKLAFAMTINKAQGQTFSKIGLDLTNGVCNHGQLYVALSRIRSWDSFKIYTDLKNENNYIKNYVYKELYS